MVDKQSGGYISHIVEGSTLLVINKTSGPVEVSLYMDIPGEPAMELQIPPTKGSTTIPREGDAVWSVLEPGVWYTLRQRVPSMPEEVVLVQFWAFGKNPELKQ